MLAAAEAISHGYYQTQCSIGIDVERAKPQGLGKYKHRQLMHAIPERTPGPVINLGSFSEFGSRLLRSIASHCALTQIIVTMQNALTRWLPINFPSLREVSVDALHMLVRSDPNV